MKKQKRVLTILSAAAVLFLFLLTASCGSGEKTGKYNVVLIVADALRSDVLGCYSGHVPTPNIDRLAQQGMLFENAYSTAPSTMPSSVGMFTGNYPGCYGVVAMENREKSSHQFAFYVNDNETLLAEALKERGCEVLMDVENKLAGMSNNLQGFSELRKTKKNNKKEIALVENAIGIKFLPWQGKPGITTLVNRMFAFLHYLLTVPREQNFFLMKWFIDPHAPYNPIEEFKKKITFDLSKLPRPESFYSETAGTFKKLARENKLSADEIAYIKVLYEAEVESVDQRVGYILKALKQRRLLDKTFIVFTSDHGELFGEHGLMGHGHHYYEPLLHVPLIIAGPGIPAGKREKTIVSHLDLMPTLKDLLGIEYDHNMRGESYSALFSGEAVPDRAQYFDRATNVLKKTDRSALLMDGYKLIVTKKGAASLRYNNPLTYQLFNLSEDPGELKDISSESRRMVQKMIKRFIDFRKEIDLRLKRNIAKISDKVNFDKKWLEAAEELKALGYL